MIASSEENNEKNVIMICLDGCRFDRAKDSNILTNYIPNTVFFSQAITYAPYTNSALHAVFSGSYGNRNGCYSYWHSLKFKTDLFKTLTEYLHESKYFTYADIHSKLAIPLQSFDEIHLYDESESSNLFERHEKILEKLKEKNENGKNFFLYLHYESIHTGIMDSVLKKYNNFSKEYFDNRKSNEERYDLLFNKAEEYMKNIFEKIQKLNLLENSLLIIFSDHGISVGEKFGERAYGAFCYDYTIRTFCSFISAEFDKSEIKQQIRHVDFLPTILDYLKINKDSKYEKIDGKSLLPLINGQSVNEEIAFTETANPLQDNSPPKRPNTRSVRTSDWKLIFNEYNNTKELYKLRSDPDEETNLIGSNLEIEQELWNKLLDLQNA